MIKRAAAAASLRSPRHKLKLFLDFMQPTENTTVVDVGVADTLFGEGEGLTLTHNFLVPLYAWHARMTAVGCSRRCYRVTVLAVRLVPVTQYSTGTIVRIVP